MKVNVLFTFSSTSTSQTQINVHGWRTYFEGGGYDMRYNQSMCVLNVGIDSQNYPTTWNPINQNTQIPDDNLKPLNPVISNSFGNANLLFAVREDGKFYRRSMTGSSVTAGSYLEISWRRRDAE